VSFHYVVRFDPRPGAEGALREVLLGVVEPSRAEAGCLAFHVYESVREPARFAIHSQWVDETAFEVHAAMPHTMRFVAVVEQLTGQPVAGLRSRSIAGGVGAAAARP
jgi:quinol monooxygenase YgiN